MASRSEAKLDIVITGLWVVAVANAFYLFDNMDGAASTMEIAANAGTSTWPCQPQRFGGGRERRALRGMPGLSASEPR